MSLTNRRSLGCLLLSLCALAVVGGSPGDGDKPKETLTQLTYAQLGQFVHDQKGKVVYVDFWNNNCPPCKNAMPGLAQLQEKYRDKGFLAVTVNLDDPTNADQATAALAFLGKENLNLKVLTHIQLNEKTNFAKDTLHIMGVPLGYLFDRDGRLVERYPKGISHKDLEKRVGELLGK